MQAGDNRRQLIEQYTNLEKLDREIVDKLIDYIEVGKRIPGTRKVPVNIHWNFWGFCYLEAKNQIAKTIL